MSKSYGYCLLSLPGPDQRGLIERFCAERGRVPSRILADEAGARDTAWFERPAGRELAGLVNPGDEVVIAGLAAVFTSRRDVLNAWRQLQERGVPLHFASLPGLPSGLSLSSALAGVVIRTLDAFAAFDSSARGDAVRRGMRARRLSGQRYTNHPGYGFKWARWRGGQRRIPDEYERAVIGRIIEWRHQGHSWYSIAADLLRCHVRTAAGREWSPSRVRRAYLAAQGNPLPRQAAR